MDYKYDSESDVLAITITKSPFDHAEEMGDFVVHFNKKNKPVYVEILNAHKFLTNATTKLPKAFKKDMLHSISA